MNNKEISEAIEKIMKELPQRSREVLEQRFGLKKGQKRKTLEAIGNGYGITRERIRQIENAAKKLILDSEALLANTHKSVDELKKAIDEFGGVVPEKVLLNNFSEDEDVQDHLHFILNLAEPFKDAKLPELHDKVWYTDENSFEAFIKSLDKLYKDLDTDELLTESEILERFAEKLKQHSNNKNLLKNETIKHLISISKKIGSNGIQQWGRTDSRNISAKGVKDYAFLILNELGKPLHFREITEVISDRFKKKVNVATVHNELIKDPRFILIGRGKYGLKSWDRWSGGTVKEVITEILKKNKKAMSKEDIIEEVLKRKDVRKQTIIINLSNKAFRRTKDGRYTLNKK